MLTIYDTKSSIEPLKYSRLASSTKFSLSVFKNSFFNDNNGIWKSLNDDINGFEALNDEPFSYSFSTEWDKGPGFKAAEKLNGFVKDDIVKMLSGKNYMSLPVTNEWSQKFAQKASPLSLSLKFKVSAIQGEIASCTAIEIIRFLSTLALPPVRYSLGNLYKKIEGAIKNVARKPVDQMDMKGEGLGPFQKEGVAAVIAKDLHDLIENSKSWEDLQQKINGYNVNKRYESGSKKIRFNDSTKARINRTKDALLKYTKHVLGTNDLKDKLILHNLPNYNNEKNYKEYLLNQLSEETIKSVLKNSTETSAEVNNVKSKFQYDSLITQGEAKIKEIVGLNSIKDQPRGQFTVYVKTPDMNPINCQNIDWYVKSFTFKPSVQYEFINLGNNIRYPMPIYVEFNVELETTMELSNKQLNDLFNNPTNT